MKGGTSSGNDLQSQSATPGGEYLAFRLGEEEYCVDASKVREIRSYEQPGAVANVPEFIKGVINLRGAIVPIVDMRIKFKLREVHYDELTAVVIVTVGDRLVGMVVDVVADAIKLAPEGILPAPQSTASVGVEYVIGQAQVGKRVLLLLDIDKLMTSKDMALVHVMR